MPPPRDTLDDDAPTATATGAPTLTELPAAVPLPPGNTIEDMPAVQPDEDSTRAGRPSSIAQQREQREQREAKARPPPPRRVYPPAPAGPVTASEVASVSIPGAASRRRRKQRLVVISLALAGVAVALAALRLLA